MSRETRLFRFIGEIPFFGELSDAGKDGNTDETDFRRISSVDDEVDAENGEAMCRSDGVNGVLVIQRPLSVFDQ